MRFNVGWMKAFVTKAMGRRFQVRTPSAVCSVRGTEFDLSVSNEGRTSVNLFQGQLGVADNRGNEVLLREGQRVDVDHRGLGAVGQATGKAQGEESQLRQALKREVGLEMSKEQVQAAAAIEQKTAVYQQGKVMIDVNGNRVRLEEYIMLPSADQYKFVALCERADRFDYFFRQGTFNKVLPSDLSVALRQISGCAGAPCEYWLTSFRTVYSNTADAVVEDASGGHLSDLNNNQVAGDEVAYGFDPTQNAFRGITAGEADTAANNPGRNKNTPFWTALYDTYSLKYDNVTHNSWVSGVGAYNPAAGGPNCSAAGVGFGCGGIQSMGNSHGIGDQRVVTNVTSVIRPPCVDQDNCTGWRENGKFHYVIYSENGGKTIWDKYDTYVIDDNGQVADFSDLGSTEGKTYKEALLRWNYQMVITASEFQGRKIDLVFEPKILIQSGLIP
jgi:hypothetical protein